jgi:hypothetical protein
LDETTKNSESHLMEGNEVYEFHGSGLPAYVKEANVMPMELPPGEVKSEMMGDSPRVVELEGSQVPQLAREVTEVVKTETPVIEPSGGEQRKIG